MKTLLPFFNCTKSTLSLLLYLISYISIGQSKNYTVPFKAQVLPGDWENTKNCGPTCVLMIDGYYKKYVPTEKNIKSINDWMGTPTYNGVVTNTTKLEELATKYCKLSNVSHDNASSSNAKNTIVDELNQGYPLICAVRLKMTNLVDKSNGHFMVIRGYNSEGVYVNDPGRSLESGQGENKYYLWETFLKSWETQNYAFVKIHHITTPAPSIPTLSTPAQNANNVSIKNGISFKWSSTNADKYRIQIIEASKFVSFSTSTGFINATCTNCPYSDTTSASSFLWTKAESGKTYYWTVRASGIGGVSNFSNYSKFTTETLTASPPTLTGTATICKGASTTLTATGCNGIVNWSDNQTGTTVSVKPSATTTYTATCTVNGVKSANSNAVTVTVNPVPTAPTLTASLSTISAGKSTILTASNCNGIVTWDSPLGTGTSKTVTPNVTTTYKATCSTNNCMSIASTITITVNNPPTITGTAI